MLVSIITPTFNRAQFLEKCILSVKNQDYPLIEHIVQDGGSTDDSLQILKQYEGGYNLKWFSEKDNGCADGMNKGFQKATGEIYCWLDSDDFYLPGTIKKVVEIFKKHPEVDVVFGDVLIADKNGKIIDYTKQTDFSIKEMMYVTMTLNTQATFWRAALHKKIGPFNTKYARIADADFFVRMGLSGARFYHIRKFLSAYRFHSLQLSRSVDEVRVEGEKMLAKYGRENPKSLVFKWKKTAITAGWIFKYIKQGDMIYVLRGFLKRAGLIKRYNAN